MQKILGLPIATLAACWVVILAAVQMEPPIVGPMNKGHNRNNL